MTPLPFLLVLERLFIAVLSVILVLLPVHAFLSTWLGTSIGPLLLWKSWKELVLAMLVPLVVYYCYRRPPIAKSLLSRRVNQLVAAYVLLHIVAALIARTDTTAALAGLLMNLRFFAIFILAQVVVESGNPWAARLKAWVPVWLLGTMGVLAVLAMLQVTVLPPDFLTHFGYNRDTTIAPTTLVDENPDALRAFATLRGPNTLGAYLLLPLAMAAVLPGGLRRKMMVPLPGWLRGWHVATAGFLGLIALGLSGSRSAWIGLVVAVLALATMSLPTPRLQALLKKYGLVAGLAVAILAWASITIPAVRLAIFHSSPGDDSLLEGSTELHWQATTEGIQLALQHPFGMGPGSSGPATYYRDIGVNLPENYFVQLAQEVGLLGLVLFVAICWLIARQLYTQKNEAWPRLLLASFTGLTVINLFLHGWADDPTAMTWWGLAGLYLWPRTKIHSAALLTKSP